MTAKDNPIRVLAICEPGPTQQQITTALSAQQEFELADVLASTERLAREVRAVEPAIILVDHLLGGQPTLDVIDELALQFPEVAVLAILPGDDPLRAQQVMLAGARAFLVQPFTQVNLLSTLRRVRDLEARRLLTRAVVQSEAAEESRPLRTLAVFSPRGGVGCSTVAVNLALALLEQTRENVLLVEGKLFFGHLDVMLNIRTKSTIADLIPHVNNLDDGLIQDVITEHASGLNVLLSPSNVQVAQGIRPEDLYNVVIGMQRSFDYLVIDAGSSLTENTVTVLDTADRILLITNPDLAALHDASRFIQISRSLAYPPEKLLILLNRAGMPGGVKSRDIENALHHELFAQIPDDGPNVLRSLNRGIPLLLRYPRSPASRAFQELGKQLARLSAPQAVAGSVPSTRADSKLLARFVTSQTS